MHIGSYREMSNSSGEDSNIYSDVLNLAFGISGLFCCLFLIPILIIEVVYVCRYKTTFLQRLWFYLTIIITFVNGGYALNLGHGVYYQLYLLISGLAFTYAIIAELIVIASINLTIVSKVYMYSVNSPKRQLLHSSTEYMIFCCLYTKCKEVIYLLIVLILSAILTCVFIVPLLLLITLREWSRLVNQNAEIPGNNTNTIVFVVLPAIGVAIDIVLGLISTMLLLVWYYRMRKKKLLNDRIKLVYKKTILIVGLLCRFLFLWIILWELRIVPFSDLNIAASVLRPLTQGTIPLVFFSYTVTSSTVAGIYNRRKKKPAAIEVATHPTVPPSERVSLPSDTALHAPNFLSPSTAGPTETVQSTEV